mgnify:CR=1 FL=1
MAGQRRHLEIGVPIEGVFVCSGQPSLGWRSGGPLGSGELPRWGTNLGRRSRVNRGLFDNTIGIASAMICNKVGRANYSVDKLSVAVINIPKH